MNTSCRRVQIGFTEVSKGGVFNVLGVGIFYRSRHWAVHLEPVLNVADV